MNLLSTENISKNYGDKILFEELSFGIMEGEKIGLIGVNGTGKSTFLKVLVGLDDPDTGKILKVNHAKIEYLPQNPLFDDDATVLQQIFRGNSTEMTLLRAYEQTLEKMKTDPDDKILQQELLNLNHKMDALGAWQLEREAKTILTKLGVSDFNALVGTLSGGQRKRIALASALISPSDLLILDEPTNHIDNETIDWLEEYLNKRSGALLMVTHDRYFLDRITNRIIELDNGNLYKYTGNYSTFLELKADREEKLQSSEIKRQNLLRRELAWIRRGAQARSTKQKARIDRFERLQEDEVDIPSNKVEISIGTRRLGKKVIELEHIHQNFGPTICIDDFSYTVLRNDRIGIIGPNGTGKSTLLNIMSGRLNPSGGEVAIGETVKIGYFSQENLDMDETLRVIEYIREGAEFVTTGDGSKISASQMLERFLFPPSTQWTLISKLSGGEKRRLYLLRVLMETPNVILLDEPTNDLDIQTLSILEEYLEEFNGAVIIVSHDRYFLDKMAEKIFFFEGNGTIAQHVGNYSDYIAFRKEQSQHASNEAIPSPREKNIKEYTKKDKPLKFTFNEQREYETIDDSIAEHEKQLEEINVEMNKTLSDFELLQTLIQKKQDLEHELDHLMERWTYLNELADKIAENNKK